MIPRALMKRPLSQQDASDGRRFLESMLQADPKSTSSPSPEGRSVVEAMLAEWKRDHCHMLGHPLEVREGYALFCVCGDRFGAISEDELAEEEAADAGK